jgi:deazaflavin-dependent oxidoreductase (nitroreductase family)
MPIPDSEVTWNENHVADFRAHGGQVTEGPLKGSNLLLMTSIGAKSGEPRVTPLGYTRDGERWVVVGSNSGFDHDPAWVANIRSTPIVTIEVGTERFAARATITTGAERERLWASHTAAIPAFGRYEQMTARQIPVVTFERTEVPTG